MSSSSSAARPRGNHRAPRKGGRVLTGRSVRVEGTRRTELDLHHLGRALLRLAQEHYDAQDHAASTKAAAAPHEADTATNRWARGTSGAAAQLGRLAGTTG